MKKKLYSLTALIIVLSVLFIYINSAVALDVTPNLDAARSSAGYNAASENTVPQIIGQIVAIVLAFVGMIFFMMIIFSGVQWMTAGGNEEKVKQAKTRLFNSIMGLTFVVAAYFLTWLIKVTLLGA